MSVFRINKSHKNNIGHFIIISAILLVGFSASVYFLKHPVVESGANVPVATSDKSTDKTKTVDKSDKTTTNSSSNASQNSNNSAITQTGLPVTGQGNEITKVIFIFVLSYALSKYILSNVKLNRLF